MSEGFLIFTLRPDGTSLWIPEELSKSMRLPHGARMTAEQYGSAPVQALIEKRRKEQSEKTR